MRAQFIKRLNTAIDIQQRMQRGFPCRMIFLMWDRKLQKFAMFTDLMANQLVQERLDETQPDCFLTKKRERNYRYASMYPDRVKNILKYGNN